LIDNVRNPSLLRAKFIQKVFMGFFLGTLYLRTNMDQDGVINIKGALFYYISELTYSTVFGIQTFLPADFPLLVREYHDGIYPVACYYIAKVFSYLPIFTVDGICMVCISYYMIGLYPAPATFLTTVATCILIEWSAASIGIMLSSVSPSYAIAVSVSGPLLTVFSITGGLYTNIRMIPESVRWVFSYLPIFTVDGICMVCISYYMIGLYPAPATFLTTVATCILIEWSAASIGIMLSSISTHLKYSSSNKSSVHLQVSPSYAIAVSVSGPLLTVFSITGGLYTNIRMIPESVRWVQYFSWYIPASSCESSGEAVIGNLYFEDRNQYFNMGAMLFYVICVFLIGYIGLVVRVLLSR
uniref:ABC2_membrane domain-containing protein n=1 Tax=Gongylonema pulchrum TaxID=637853 RepID=A0A183E9U2_9BILA